MKLHLYYFKKFESDNQLGFINIESEFVTFNLFRSENRKWETTFATFLEVNDVIQEHF
jgi:hypothetical protein